MEKKKIESEIADEKEDIENIKGYWNEIPPEGLSGVYSDLAGDSETIGIYNIILGNKQEALNWFKQATDYHKKEKENADKAKPEINYELSYKEFIYSAILTQDEKIIKDTAQHMCDMEDAILNKIIKGKTKTKLAMLLYRHGFILANLIVGNYSKTKEHLDAFERHHKTLIPEEYPITDAVKGILEKNPKLTKDGINKILKRHIGLTRGSLPQEQKLVCIPIVCMLTLAKLKGMNIKDIYIESKYIPKILFEK